MSDVFAARFHGTCASCGDRFPAVASIRWVGGTYIHADCNDLPDPSPIEGQRAPSAGSGTQWESATVTDMTTSNIARRKD